MSKMIGAFAVLTFCLAIIFGIYAAVRFSEIETKPAPAPPQGCADRGGSEIIERKRGLPRTVCILKGK